MTSFHGNCQIIVGRWLKPESTLKLKNSDDTDMQYFPVTYYVTLPNECIQPVKFHRYLQAEHKTNINKPAACFHRRQPEF